VIFSVDSGHLLNSVNMCENSHNLLFFNTDILTYFDKCVKINKMCKFFTYSY